MGAVLLSLVLVLQLSPSGHGDSDVDRVAALFESYSTALLGEAAPSIDSPAGQLRGQLTTAVEAATALGAYPVLQELGLQLRKTDADFQTQVIAAQAMYADFSAPLMRSFAAMLEATATHPVCAVHFRQHPIHESRCSTVQYCHALMLLKRCGEMALAEEMYERATSWSTEQPAPAIGWVHWQQTPDRYLPGLRSQPWWDNADVPLTQILEANQPALRRDAEKLLKKRARGGWDQTYSSLIAGGDWQKLSLYTGKVWDKKLRQHKQSALVASTLCFHERP